MDICVCVRAQTRILVSCTRLNRLQNALSQYDQDTLLSSQSHFDPVGHARGYDLQQLIPITILKTLQYTTACDCCLCAQPKTKRLDDFIQLL